MKSSRIVSPSPQSLRATRHVKMKDTLVTESDDKSSGQSKSNHNHNHHPRLQSSQQARQLHFLTTEDTASDSFESSDQLFKKKFKGPQSTIPNSNELYRKKLNEEHFGVPEFQYDQPESDRADNLDEWYSTHKTQFEDLKRSPYLKRIQSKNQEKLMLEAMKEKFRTPHVDSTIVNSILYTNIPGELSQIVEDGVVPSIEEVSESQNKIEIQSSGGIGSATGGHSSAPKPNSHFQSKVDLESNRNPFRPATTTTHANTGKNNNSTNFTHVFNASAANNLGNICTSLTLLQQFKPGKEFINPEIVKKDNVMKLVHNIIQDKMTKIMVNPKEFYERFQGTKATTNLGKKVESQTLKNFKNLRKYFQYGQKIDYDVLLANLVAQKHSQPTKTFAFSEEELDPISSFKEVERELKDKYKSIVEAIREKKEEQRTLRVEVAKWVESLNELNIDVTFYNNRRDDILKNLASTEKALKKIVPISRGPHQPQSSRGKELVSSQLSQQSLFRASISGEQYRLNCMHSDSKLELSRIEEKLAGLNRECRVVQGKIDGMSETIEQLMSDAEKLKTSKSSLKIYLRDNYLKIIKKDLNVVHALQEENFSLVWIIKSMNLIGQHIDRSAFPSYLDEISLNFLFKTAEIENTIESLRDQLKSSDPSLLLHKSPVSQIINCQKSHTKDQALKKLKSLTVSNLQVRRSIDANRESLFGGEFEEGDDFMLPQQQQQQQQQYPYLNSNNCSSSESSNMHKVSLIKQKIIDQISDLQKELEDLHEAEHARLITNSEKREDPHLLKRLVAIFGTIQGAEKHSAYTSSNLTSAFKKVEEKLRGSSSTSALSQSSHLSSGSGTGATSVLSSSNGFRKSRMLKRTDQTQSMDGKSFKLDSNDSKSEIDFTSTNTSKAQLIQSHYMNAALSMKNMRQKYLDTISGGTNSHSSMSRQSSSQNIVLMNGNSLNTNNTNSMSVFDQFMVSRYKQPGKSNFEHS